MRCLWALLCTPFSLCSWCITPFTCAAPAPINIHLSLPHRLAHAYVHTHSQPNHTQTLIHTRTGCYTHKHTSLSTWKVHYPPLAGFPDSKSSLSIFNMEEIARVPSPHGGSIYQTLYSELNIRSRGDEFGASHESPRVLSVLSSLLERIVAKNDTYVAQWGHALGPLHRLTVFHGLKAPSISVQKYVERIFKYANCSPSCFVVAYAYLDRFIHQQPGLPITSLNVHRLLITSVMVAAKFLDDAYYNNAYYAKVGGVSTQEMNRLELEFLFRLGFRLQVTVQVFDSYCSYLEREVAGFGMHAHVERAPFPSLMVQGKHCIGAAQQEAHEVEQQNNVYVAINILESVS